MATMKDIAREAGVSYGTVSNVMNKTGKVSVEKIRLVEEAARRLEYRPHAQAQRLREGASHMISLVLPSLQPIYTVLYNSLVKCLKAYDYRVSLTITEDVAELERKEIATVLSERPDAVIAVSCLPDAEAEYNCENLILLERWTKCRQDLATRAGFDYAQAGDEIAGYCLAHQYHKAALVFNSQQFSVNGSFADRLVKQGLKVTAFGSDDKLLLRESLDFISRAGTFDVVITLDSMRAEALVNAAAYLGQKLCPILSVSERTVMPRPDYIQYVMDYQKLGQELTEYVIAVLRNERPAARELIVRPDGFTFGSKCGSFISPAGERRIRMLTIESPTTDAIKGLLGGLEGECGIRAEVTTLEFDELHQLLSESCAWEDYDLIRMDMAWLPDLGGRIYKPLPLTGQAVEKQQDFLAGVCREYGQDGGQMLALPLDPSAQLLFYRKDLFEDAKIKRQYYEQYHEELRPPVSYEQLNRIAAFFTRALNPESLVTYGAVLTAGSPAVAAADFLPYLLEHNQTMDSLTAESLRQSLELYLETLKYTDQKPHRWWADSVECFARGEAAMMTVFNNYATAMVNSRSSAIMGKIGCAEIPGARPLLGGGVLGLSRTTGNDEACMSLLNWLYKEEIARAVTLCGGLSPKRAVYGDFDVLSLFPWMDICRNSLAKGTRQYFGSQFDSQSFERVLGELVQSVCNGRLGSEDAAGRLHRLITEGTSSKR